MSEKISRRVFLKTTGFAALSVAAAGVLGGCDISPLPGNAVLPAVEETDYQDVGTTCQVALTTLSDQWESYSTFESNNKPHRYIYVGLYIRNHQGETTLKTSNITCTIGGTKRTVVGLGNVGLNKDGTAYQFPDTWKVTASTSSVSTPVYIDLGDNKLSDLVGATVEITVTIGKEKATFTYATPSDNPSHNQSTANSTT